MAALSLSTEFVVDQHGYFSFGFRFRRLNASLWVAPVREPISFGVAASSVLISCVGAKRSRCGTAPEW